MSIYTPIIDFSSWDFSITPRNYTPPEGTSLPSGPISPYERIFYDKMEINDDEIDKNTYELINLNKNQILSAQTFLHQLLDTSTTLQSLNKNKYNWEKHLSLKETTNLFFTNTLQIFYTTSNKSSCILSQLKFILLSSNENHPKIELWEPNIDRIINIIEDHSDSTKEFLDQLSKLANRINNLFVEKYSQEKISSLLQTINLIVKITSSYLMKTIESHLSLQNEVNFSSDLHSSKMPPDSPKTTPSSPTQIKRVKTIRKNPSSHKRANKPQRYQDFPGLNKSLLKTNSSFSKECENLIKKMSDFTVNLS